MCCSIIGFVIGVLWLQQQSGLWTWPALILLGCLSALLLLLKRHCSFAPLNHVIHGIVGLMLGWVWASGCAHTNLDHPLSSALEDKPILIVGTVSSLPSELSRGQRFQLMIEQSLDPTVLLEDLPHQVLLTWNNEISVHQEIPNSSKSENKTVHPGERWRLNVRLRRPHGLANAHGFDLEMWLLEHQLGATGSVVTSPMKIVSDFNQRISPFVFSWRNYVERQREKLRNRIKLALPEYPYAPIIIALVIGDQQSIPQQDWSVFSRTGINHLVAISGLHVTLVAGIFAQIMGYLWRHSFFVFRQLPLLLPAQKVAALAGVMIALLYVALAGFGVPAQRTLMMLSVVAAAVWFDRTTSAPQVLCLALLGVLLVDPWAVMGAGFWLSFAAVAFIFYAQSEHHPVEQTAHADHALSLFGRIKYQLYHHCAQGSKTQYVVTVGLLPLTMLLFYQVSLVSPIANAVAIPVISLLVTPFALVGSMLPGELGTAVLALAHSMLSYLIVFLNWLNQFSWAVWQLPRPEPWMFLLALVGTCWFFAPAGWPLRWAGILSWLPLCLNTNLYPKQGELTVTAFDVGQGMSLLIETAQHRLLYDTGPVFSAKSDAGQQVINPYLKMRGIRYLDGLMISHNDNDHSGGALSVLQQIRIGKVMSSLDENSPIVHSIREQSQHQQCLAGQSWNWDGVQFEVVHPDESIYESEKYKPNARSCTLKITLGKQSILLAGDIEARQEKDLVNRIPDKLAATVLLAPHHGSGTSSTMEFLQTVHPQWALFQLGYLNRYHHPTPAVWQRYADLGITRLRTDQSGAITLHFAQDLTIDEYRVSHARYWHSVAN